MAANPDNGRALESGRLELLGRLLPGALHELSNPLLALSGTVELLLADAEPGSRSRERLELMHRTAGEMSELVRTLQRLARERDEPEQPIDVAELTRETAAIATRFSGLQDVEAAVASKGPQTVRAAPATLRQALLALVLEAIRATPAGVLLEIVVDADGVAVPHATGDGPARTAAAALGAQLEPLAGGGTLLRLVL